MQSHFKDHLIPSKLELVLYGVLTAVIAFFANFSYLTTYLLHETGNVPKMNEGAFSIYVDRILSFVENLPFLPNSAVFIFWSLVGLLIYSFLQSSYNVYLQVRDDIDMATHFLHPSNYIGWKFWAEVLLQLLAHFSLYAVIILWALLTGYTLIPLSAYFSRQFFAASSFESLPAFISSMILLYIGVLVFAMILKLFFKRKQLVI